MTLLHFLPLLAACAEAAWPVAAAKHLAVHHHQRQQRGAPAPIPATTTTPVTTYTLITPSPSASPIAVTSLSQVVTSYIPQMTICALPSTSTGSTTRWGNNSNALAIVPRTASASMDCTTEYSSTLLTVCATTLQGLGSTVAVTDCNQLVTFSSDYGYSVVTATLTTSTLDSSSVAQTTTTSTPPIATITSYYIAPWQALTTAPILTMNVTKRICSTAMSAVTSTTAAANALAPTPSLHCIDVYEVWSTTTTTSISSYTSTIDIVTTMSGSQHIVIIATMTTSLVADEAVLNLSTELVLPTTVEKEVRAVSTVKSVGSTSTMEVFPGTLGLGMKAVAEGTSTSTTTVLSTSTVTRTLTSTTTIHPAATTPAAP